MSRDLNHLKMGLFVFVSLVLHYFPSEARDYVYQNPDSGSSSFVQIQNKTNVSQPFWILFYEKEFIEEHSFDIPARTTKNLNLEGLKKPQWNFSVLTKTNLVVPLPLTSSQNSQWKWTTTTRHEMKIKGQTEVSLNFFNLYIEKQKVTLTFVNSASQVLQKTEFYTASFIQNISRVEKIPANATRLIMESDAPIQISSPDLFMPVTDTSRLASSNFKYFLVQGGKGGSSFIAPMSDPEMILKARQEILNPQGYVVFADIELNSLQPNRDFSTPEKSYWSWSIKRVTGLAQVSADWCQAYPEMIERMLHAFLRQEQVCFRGQRIIRELKPSEVQSGVLNK